MTSGMVLRVITGIEHWRCQDGFGCSSSNSYSWESCHLPVRLQNSLGSAVSPWMGRMMKVCYRMGWSLNCRTARTRRSETSEGTVESRFYLHLPRKKIRLKRFLFQFILRLESGPGWIWTCINTTSKCFLNTSRDGDSITSLGRTLSYGIVSTLTNFIQIMLNFSCQYLLFTFRKPSLISHPAVTTGGAVPEHHTVWFLARDDSSPLSQHQLD